MKTIVSLINNADINFEIVMLVANYCLFSSFFWTVSNCLHKRYKLSRKLSRKKIDSYIGYISAGISFLVIPVFMFNQQLIIRSFSLIFVALLNIYLVQIIRKRESLFASAYYFINAMVTSLMLLYSYDNLSLNGAYAQPTLISKINVSAGLVFLLVTLLVAANRQMKSRIDDIGDYTCASVYYRDLAMKESKLLTWLSLITSARIIVTFLWKLFV